MSLRFLGQDIGRRLKNINAGVSELADETDSKSVIRKGVWVRVPPPAPEINSLQTLDTTAFVGFLFFCPVPRKIRGTYFFSNVPPVFGLFLGGHFAYSVGKTERIALAEATFEEKSRCV